MMTLLLSILAMLSSFMTYVRGDYQPLDSRYAVFRGEHTGAADERGVRTNADLCMVAAFMGEDTMALKTLAFAVDTHKAVRKRPCLDGRYWGSVSARDHQWESSLWAMSVAYAAHFLWDKMDDSLRTDVYRLLRAECNYELERDIPTGFRGDTKAEENGWEVDVLAATLGLFPDDALAPRWFERMRAFAINSYSHPSDASDTTVIDPDYDGTRVCDLYRGASLYPDWTLQNHDFFHTSYQNVVIQELGEAALALRLFQGKRQKWRSRALLHNCDKVADNVLNWLTLPDGEQAMPNGNDWSLFLYDQVTSYATLACMLRDADALLFERQCLARIARRQQTTADGSFLLRPDVGARRMGVQAHRLMMTELMHRLWPTDSLRPSTWDDFARRYRGSKVFPCQQIVRTLRPDYFACFSLSQGKQSYTGYIAPINDGTTDNLVIPYRQYNTGNIVGYFKAPHGKPSARLVGKPDIRLHGDFFTVKATLAENDSTLLRRFTLKTTSRGLEYSDRVTPLQPQKETSDNGKDKASAKGNKEGKDYASAKGGDSKGYAYGQGNKEGKDYASAKGNDSKEASTADLSAYRDYTGMMAISTDEFTSRHRTLDSRPGVALVDGRLRIEANSKGKAMWTDETIDNSIRSRRLCPFLATPQWRHRVRWSVVKPTHDSSSHAIAHPTD